MDKKEEKQQLIIIEEAVEKQLVSYEKISVATNFQQEQIAVAHRTVAKGTSFAELAYFLTVCKSVNLNPFNKEVWCYKDNVGNLLVFTGRDGFLARAQQNTDWNGMRSSEVCANDEFEMDIINNQIKHSFGTKDRGVIIGAYAIVFRKKCEPTIEWVNIADYDKKRNTWNAFKADMIKKCAESHALKKAYGITGIQSEYDFEIKEGVSYSRVKEAKQLPEDKSEDRMLQLLQKCNTEAMLQAFLPDCTTQVMREAYDKRLKEIKKTK